MQKIYFVKTNKFEIIANLLYIYNKYTVMGVNKNKSISEVKVLNPSKSLHRAKSIHAVSPKWSIGIANSKYTWATKMERVKIIREGLPYSSIEVISERTNLPIKQVLQLMGVAQTTYNKKKRDKDLLTGRDSELVLVLTELLDFGLEVFNNEKEKFQRWLKKQNTSLGGVSPESLFDSLTGIQEVKNSLNRIEYGNMA